MSNGKKYGAHAIHDPTGTWIGRVVRHQTSRGTVTERERNVFTSQEEAQTWATEQLAIYLALRKERTERRNATDRRLKLGERHEPLLLRHTVTANWLYALQPKRIAFLHLRIEPNCSGKKLHSAG